MLVANGYDCFVGLRSHGCPYLLEIVSPFSIAIVDVTGFWLPATVSDFEIVLEVDPVFGCDLHLASSPDGRVKRFMYAQKQHPLSGLTDAFRRYVAVDSRRRGAVDSTVGGAGSEAAEDTRETDE